MMLRLVMKSFPKSVMRKKISLGLKIVSEQKTANKVALKGID